jgi:isopentenyl diphosphate isomerase/L-lactate dehydrogenase-like FMN-dependent dehydrogenase
VLLGPKFLQIYLTTPVDILEKIVSKADQNGYRAIVITCDHPTDRVRDHTLPLFEEASKYTDPQLQNSIAMPNMNLPDLIVKQKLSTGSTTWTNVESIKKLTKLPIICKGILSPIDAELAIKYGANGIIVRFVFMHSFS